jgi:hypothetical protein
VPWAINKLRVKTNRAIEDWGIPAVIIDEESCVFLAPVCKSFPLFLDDHLVGNGNWSLLWGGDPLGKPEPGIPGGEFNLLK